MQVHFVEIFAEGTDKRTETRNGLNRIDPHQEPRSGKPPMPVVERGWVGPNDTMCPKGRNPNRRPAKQMDSTKGTGTGGQGGNRWGGKKAVERFVRTKEI